jgi:RNA polymerase sigma-70 factor (ECF subfamily)
MSDDDAILARVRTGDGEAIAEFAQARRRQLSAYVDNQLGSALRAKVEVDDLVQDAVLRAVRSPQLFQSGERDPFGVLCHLAQEAIIDAHRRLIEAQKRAAGREVPLSGGPTSTEGGGGGLINLLVASITTPSRAFSRNQRELQMFDALAELPETDREALRLRYVEGLPTKEIAAKLGKSDGAVRVMLSRAVDKLQQMLGET